jgi:hypothetical protein
MDHPDFPARDFTSITKARLPAIIEAAKRLQADIEAGREPHIVREAIVRLMARLEGGETLAGSDAVSREFEQRDRFAIQALFDGLKHGGKAGWLGTCNTFLDAVQPSEVAEASSGDIEIIPGGFSYRGSKNDLTGRPLAMLRELRNAPDRRLTGDMLRSRMNINDEFVNSPERVIRDTAKNLRKRLKKAIRDAGLHCDDPLPSVGRGADLTYRLNMP